MAGRALEALGWKLSLGAELDSLEEVVVLVLLEEGVLDHVMALKILAEGEWVRVGLGLAEVAAERSREEVASPSGLAPFPCCRVEHRHSLDVSSQSVVELVLAPRQRPLWLQS